VYVKASLEMTASGSVTTFRSKGLVVSKAILEDKSNQGSLEGC
jgi:hypothetical protein